MCQIKPPLGLDKPAPFQCTPLIGGPFQRVIDLVGPLPVTTDLYEYILTLVDMATRRAEAIERAIPGEEVPGSIPAVAARSLLVGSVSL